MDASQVRRKKRLRQKLAQVQWLVWLVIVGLVGYYMFWRTQQVQVARIITDEFLARLGRAELSFIHNKLLTGELKTNLPEKKLQKQYDLLLRKLGRMEEFTLADSELAWTNTRCRLVYDTRFEKAPARAIFELMTDNLGRWRLDTYYFWADNWQQL
jgi:hypothetical protein